MLDLLSVFILLREVAISLSHKGVAIYAGVLTSY